ncbi:MAG: LamG domain-containing protein [Kiritimatiellae bacterium]|nr:LamG domain-containing protein [Kiritimatiellia bacterium]
MDVSWPYEVDDYNVTWPSSPRINVIGSVTNSGPGVKIPTDVSAKLWYGQAPKNHAKLGQDMVFRANEEGVALLQYTTGEMDTWFDVICSVWHDDPRVFAQTPIDWSVGVELQPKDVQYTLKFYGSNSYIVATNNACGVSSEFSVEMWVKPEHLVGAENSANLFLGSAGNPDTTYSYVLRYHTRNPQYGCFGFYVWDGSAKWALAPTTYLLEEDRWYHVAATVKQNEFIRLYINGEQVGQCGVGTPDANAAVMYVASHGGGYPHSFNGELTDLRVWNRRLSQDEIKSGMNVPLTGEESGLAAWYPMAFVNSNTVYDCTDDPSETNPKNAVLVGHVAHGVETVDVAYDGTPMSSFEQVPGYLWSGRAYNTNLYAAPLADDGTFGATALTNHVSYLYGVNTNAMEVWWFEKGIADMPTPIYWPSFPVYYNLDWPAQTNEIVIASGQGSGMLPAEWIDPQIYVQNHASLDGYNPNEEHALLLGGTLYALRNDLNVSNSSKHYVLLQYQDSVRGRPDMAVWHVAATNAEHSFTYTNSVAGKLIQAPNPLTQLPASSFSHIYSGPAWQDRKGDFWAYRGGVTGGTVDVQCRYYYPVQNGFWFPSLELQPAVATEVPWLSGRGVDAIVGTPQTVTYRVGWPDDAPEMKIAETLVKPKRGLPDIAGQKSVGIIYQQSNPITTVQTNVSSMVRTVRFGQWVDHGQNGWMQEWSTNSYTIVLTNLVEVQGDTANSVRLMDPTVIRGAVLSDTPESLGINVVSNPQDGMLYFSDLAPDLQARIFYNPNAGGNISLCVKGIYREPVGADDYLLLNLLNDQERRDLLALSSNVSWQAAVNGLPTSVLLVDEEEDTFDSLALSSSVGDGSGYVTLAFNNSTNHCDPGDPVSLSILKVVTNLYVGDLNLNYPANPLNEKTSLRYSADLAGLYSDYEFQWRYKSQVGSGSPQVPYSETDSNWLVLTNSAASYTIEGPGLKAMQDLYYTCRYRPTDVSNPAGTNWSDWTSPKLHESWIKRVLKAINPYDQRIENWYDAGPYSAVSMISQAGTRFEGVTALNQDQLNSQGLISIYETVLQRGMDMTIDGIPPQEDANANNSLMMAAGRIAQLYMLLGNEAYADAMDPTIAWSTDEVAPELGEAYSSLFCFMNQVPTLLDEELALLRGRDGSGNAQPAVTKAPVYNRLPWNFTADIAGGQVAYALNYDVRSQTNTAPAFTEEVASELFPQGHGDAYGHYLTALKGYYSLLHHPHFNWQPMSEAINVGEESSMTIDVSYMHERRMAEAAAARARTAVSVVEETARQSYLATASNVWQTVSDGDGTRGWGTADWASRAGQGAYFDWVMVNAMLPVDGTGTGIADIDRASVPELDELPVTAASIQRAMDTADQGLNPLGVANSAVPFDISPAGIDQGQSHFDQIYGRAVTALQNAQKAYDHAAKYSRALRRQNDSLQDFLGSEEDQEQAYKNRLIELFGYPYADDIGAGKTYAQGYNGPDLIHAGYIDIDQLMLADGSTQYDPATNVVQILLVDTTLTNDPSAYESVSFQPMLNALWSDAAYPELDQEKAVVYMAELHLNGQGFQAKPPSWTGTRRAEGEIQFAARDVMRAYYRLQTSIEEYQEIQNSIYSTIQLWNSTQGANANQFARLKADNQRQLTHTWTATGLQLGSGAAEMVANIMNGTASSLASKAIYMQIPIMNPAGAIKAAASAATMGTATASGIGSLIPGGIAFGLAVPAALLGAGKEYIGYATQEYMLTNSAPSSIPVELLQAMSQQSSKRLEVQQSMLELQDAFERYKNAYAEGQRAMGDLAGLRSKMAAELKEYRYKDMSFRIFRNDALGKYRSTFDLAARYAFLAAKAYDYETGLLDMDSNDTAGTFMEQIVKSTSLGAVDSGGTPQTGNSTSGDPGLADALARMNADWSVMKSRLGFNNPQTETGRFSLRSELFRISPMASSDETWQQMLRRCVVDDIYSLPAFQQYAMPFDPRQDKEPGIVIPFSSQIFFGKNYFGHDLAAGDNAYDSTHFATKIRSVGIWFDNYQSCSAASNNIPALANQPRVYLIPAGTDIIRVPSTDGDAYRTWKVVDQSIPLPYNIGGSDLDNPQWNASQYSLPESFAKTRRIPSLRAYHNDGSFDDSEFCSNSRLIGRSVWNTQWYLVIPAGTLLDDRNEAINRFIYGPQLSNGDKNRQRDAARAVKDIKLMFKTYSYFGE